MAPELSLRPAGPDDAELLYAWRNDPEVRRQSLSTEPVGWEEHVAWLRRALGDPQHEVYVAVDEGGPVGTVRLHGSGDVAALSIIVAPEHRGRRLAARLIRAATEQSVVPVEAVVRTGNAASLAAFRRAGFRDVGLERVGGIEVVRLRSS